MAEIWFWQRMVTPHMTGLAVALGKRAHDVVYVYEYPMSEERLRQGWSVPTLPGVSLRLADSAAEVESLVAQSSPHSIHICQGLWRNGIVGSAQNALRRRGMRQWVIMETVDDSLRLGFMKRALYNGIFALWRRSLEGVLANGWRTPQWVTSRGMIADRVFPFGYFLSESTTRSVRQERARLEFCFLFVGRFIKLKRLDLLIESLGRLAQRGLEFKLIVVGAGPLEEQLTAKGREFLGHRVEWLGRLPMDDVRTLMASCDCLVLPSRYDGWGAVVSESLMVGTPVISSDACGSAEVVLASGEGGVFQSEKPLSLSRLLDKVVRSGKVDVGRRKALEDWAKCLSASSGAKYFEEIIRCVEIGKSRPKRPWVFD